MFALEKKDIQGIVIFVLMIVLFSYLANWNARRLDNNVLDKNNNLVYNVGGAMNE